MRNCPEFALKVPRKPSLSQTASPRQACEVHGISKGLGAMAFVFHWIGLGILTWMINHHIADGWRTQERVHSEWMVHAIYSKQLLGVPVSPTLPTLSLRSWLLAFLFLIPLLLFFFNSIFSFSSFHNLFLPPLSLQNPSSVRLILSCSLHFYPPSLLSYLWAKPVPESGGLGGGGSPPRAPNGGYWRPDSKASGWIPAFPITLLRTRAMKRKVSLPRFDEEYEQNGTDTNTTLCEEHSGRNRICVSRCLNFPGFK